MRVCQFRHTGFWGPSYSGKFLYRQAAWYKRKRRGKIDPNALFHGVLKMNEEALNMSLRKFLKVVGVTSQQEIEKAIRAAVADGRLKGNETVQAQMVLTIGKVGLSHKVDGEIELG